MPRYTFELKDGSSPVQPLDHAEAVTHELMRGREAQTGGVAISRGKPYLAAQGGEPRIRSGPPPNAA